MNSRELEHSKHLNIENVNEKVARSCWHKFWNHVIDKTPEISPNQMQIKPVPLGMARDTFFLVQNILLGYSQSTTVMRY